MPSTMDVTVKYSDGQAVLSFRADDNDYDIYFQCEHPDHAAPIVYDFAAFACIPIAHRFRTDIILRAPVSRAAVENMLEIDEFNRLAAGRAFGFRVRCEEVVDAGPPTGQFRAHCVSTGIDSTYALLTGDPTLDFTHGMVVHGADYKAHHEVGFSGLLDRVGLICNTLGMTPVVVKTNLRSIEYSWGRHHISQLAACMHFLGPKFSDVAFAADNTLAQDMKRFPWGNNYVVGTHVGGDTMRIHYLGHEANRYQKIKALQRDGRFLGDIGVCAADKAGGGNCGMCGKCLMTRVAFECEGGTCPDIFKQMPDIARQLVALTQKEGGVTSRGAPIRANELIPQVEDPRIRRALVKYRRSAAQNS